MSVYKSKRSTSAIQYVENARQLQVFTIKNCVKFPKRYTYIVVQKIANLVEDIDTHVRVAESMMPTNLHEAQLKRDELTYTFGLLNSLDDKLQLMYDIVSDNPNLRRSLSGCLTPCLNGVGSSRRSVTLLRASRKQTGNGSRKNSRNTKITVFRQIKLL